MASTITSLFGADGGDPKRLFEDTEARISAAGFAEMETVTTAWSPTTRPAPATGPAKEPAPEPVPEPTVEERIAAAVAETEERLRADAEQATAELVAAHESREAELTSEIEKAREEGLEAGRAEAEPIVDAAMQQLAGAMGRFADATSTLVRRYKTEAAELAIELARTVAGEVLHIDSAGLERLITDAMAAVPHTDEVVLRCHPDDVETIEQLQPDLLARRRDPLHIRLSPNPAMERFGCIIEFGDGAIDARPSVALDMLAEAVRATMSGVTAGPIDGQSNTSGIRRVTTPEPDPEPEPQPEAAATADADAEATEAPDNEEAG